MTILSQRGALEGQKRRSGAVPQHPHVQVRNFTPSFPFEVFVGIEFDVCLLQGSVPGAPGHGGLPRGDSGGGRAAGSARFTIWQLFDA